MGRFMKILLVKRLEISFFAFRNSVVNEKKEYFPPDIHVDEDKEGRELKLSIYQHMALIILLKNELIIL